MCDVVFARYVNILTLCTDSECLAFKYGVPMHLMNSRYFEIPHCGLSLYSHCICIDFDSILFLAGKGLNQGNPNVMHIRNPRFLKNSLERITGHLPTNMLKYWKTMPKFRLNIFILFTGSFSSRYLMIFRLWMIARYAGAVSTTPCRQVIDGKKQIALNQPPRWRDRELAHLGHLSVVIFLPITPF